LAEWSQLLTFGLFSCILRSCLSPQVPGGAGRCGSRRSGEPELWPWRALRRCGLRSGSLRMRPPIPSSGSPSSRARGRPCGARWLRSPGASSPRARPIAWASRASAIGRASA
jgi:hypothetical protein